MARKRARKSSRLDNAAIAVGSALGSLAAKIDRLTRQREAITADIRHHLRQAEGALRGLAKGENPFPLRGRKARKARKKSTAAKQTR